MRTLINCYMQQSCYSISHIGKCAEIAQMMSSNEPHKIFLNSDIDFILLPACWKIYYFILSYFNLPILQHN